MTTLNKFPGGQPGGDVGAWNGLMHKGKGLLTTKFDHRAILKSKYPGVGVNLQGKLMELRRGLVVLHEIDSCNTECRAFLYNKINGNARYVS